MYREGTSVPLRILKPPCTRRYCMTRRASARATSPTELNGFFKKHQIPNPSLPPINKHSCPQRVANCRLLLQLLPTGIHLPHGYTQQRESRGLGIEIFWSRLRTVIFETRSLATETRNTFPSGDRGTLTRLRLLWADACVFNDAGARWQQPPSW